MKGPRTQTPQRTPQRQKTNASVGQRDVTASRTQSAPKLSPQQRMDDNINASSAVHGIHREGAAPSEVADMRSELEELRKDVRGLHEAFHLLKKEHSEMRSELRVQQKSGIQGGLPVESAVANQLGRFNSKQAISGKSTPKGSATFALMDDVHDPHPPPQSKAEES